MARTRILKPDSKHHYRLVCEGLEEAELHSLYSMLRTEIVKGEDDLVAFRNPFPPHFEPHTVHEILITVAAVGSALSRKMLDLISDIVKRKLEARDGAKRTVTIYDHRGEPHTVVEVNSKKRRR